jgi:hypothetical protein
MLLHMKIERVDILGIKKQKGTSAWEALSYLWEGQLGFIGCLGSEPRLAQSQTGGMRLLSGA